MERKRVLILNGSPKRTNSTSYSIGNYLIKNFSEDKYLCKTEFVYDQLSNEDGINALINSFNESDIIIFSYPLYVDTLPALDIRAMELITEHRRKYKIEKNQIFLVLANCGFFEGKQISNSINVCHFFAKENELNWYGGISVGAGGMYSGKSLEKVRGVSKKLREALELTAEAITNNTALPVEKISKLTVPGTPKFIYFNAANIGFKHSARKNGVLKILQNRPFIEGS